MDDQNKIYHPRIKNRIKGAVGFILGIFFHDKTESIKEKYFTIKFLILFSKCIQKNAGYKNSLILDDHYRAVEHRIYRR